MRIEGPHHHHHPDHPERHNRHSIRMKSISISPLSPRIQWDKGAGPAGGYCGETCLQEAGLAFGQWVSQGTIRSLDGQVLVGADQNALLVADQLGLDATNMLPDGQDAISFIKEAQAEMAKGHVVMMGVFVNDHLDSADDPSYDHIVPLLNVEGNPDDPQHCMITFSDNGLYTDDCPPLSPPNSNHTYTISLAQFMQTRSGADSADQPYSLNINSCFGLILNGDNDSGTSLPINLSASSDSEPDPAAPIGLTPSVSNLTSGQNYSFYGFVNMQPPTGDYNNFFKSYTGSTWEIPPQSTTIPSNFSGIVRHNFQATGTNDQLPELSLLSSSSLFCRCVPR
ncbi:MAG TPA: hypothetical protein VLF94_00915 [Chlamydiales bacterium]|nr:hypothetical protein [Chlamydiales bacterium]